MSESAEKNMEVMGNREMGEKLEKNIEFLRDSQRGFIKAGYPRFMRLFGRDSLIVANQLLESEPNICRLTLKILSEFQGKKFDKTREEEPGKILHEHEIEHDKFRRPQQRLMQFPNYGSIDSTPWFLITFGNYFEKSGDRKFLNQYRRNIQAAVDWMERKINDDPSGFLRYQRQQENGQLFHQGWKDSFEDHLKIQPPVAIVEVQGYGYAAFGQAAKILDNEKYNRLAAELKERFNERFWMSEEKYFALALDGKGRQRKAITSNPGHLLFTGIIEKDKADSVVKRLFEPDMWTPFGVRTHSVKEADFDYKGYHLGSVWPHDNWIIAQGLKRLGRHDEYQRVKSAVLAAYRKLGFMPELYAVTPDGALEQIEIACKFQAWASGAVLEFLKNS